MYKETTEIPCYYAQLVLGDNNRYCLAWIRCAFICTVSVASVSANILYELFAVCFFNFFLAFLGALSVALCRGLSHLYNGFILVYDVKCHLFNFLPINGHLYPFEFLPPSVIHGLQ